MKRVLTVLLVALLLCSAVFANGANETAKTDGEFKFSSNVNIVIPYKAGGGVDVTVRALLENGLRDELGGSVSVTNTPGGNTLIGAQSVLAAEPDGYTIFINTCAAFLAAPQMYGNPYSIDDFQYITTLGVTDLIVAAGPSAPAKTVDDLIAYGKTHSEGVTVGCAGYGDISALGAYITLEALGVKCELIPYDGAAESTAAWLGGHVQYVCATASSIASHCEQGNMTALYETGSLDDNLCNVPSITTLGHPEAATPYYRIVMVTKDVQANAVEAIRTAFKNVIENPERVAALKNSKQNIQGVVSDPAELKKLIEKDYAAYGEMVKTLNLQNQ